MSQEAVFLSLCVSLSSAAALHVTRVTRVTRVTIVHVSTVTVTRSGKAESEEVQGAGSSNVTSTVLKRLFQFQSYYGIICHQKSIMPLLYLVVFQKY